MQLLYLSSKKQNLYERGVFMNDDMSDLIAKLNSMLGSDSNNNLKDKGNAKAKYQEVVDLVRFGKSKLNIFTEKEYYEGHIDKNNGADWNQTAPIDTKPTIEDFKKTVSNYLVWKTSNILKNKNKDDSLGK